MNVKPGVSPRPPTLSARQVGQRFGERWIVRDADFDAVGGSPTFLIGPNGTGKTTLLDLLGGEAVPTGGRVSLDDVPITEVPREAVRFVHQKGALLDALTVRETIGLWKSLYGETGVEDLIDQFGLATVGDDRVKTLSGGEGQRLRLALAAVGQATVYLLDEPTNSLDRDARFLVREFIAELAATGAIVVVATHDLDLLSGQQGPVHAIRDARLIPLRSRLDGDSAVDLAGVRDVNELLDLLEREEAQS